MALLSLSGHIPYKNHTVNWWHMNHVIFKNLLLAFNLINSVEQKKEKDEPTTVYAVSIQKATNTYDRSIRAESESIGASNQFVRQTLVIFEIHFVTFFFLGAANPALHPTSEITTAVRRLQNTWNRTTTFIRKIDD